jgi:enoyl-CoA hydratase/carnithine racemase
MLQRLEHGKVLELRLDRPPVNALDPGVVKALRDAVAHAPDGGARAIVICGRPGMFSAGLDVPALLALERHALHAFWGEFFALLRTLAASPLPVCAAMGGHAPAGGMVLGLYCDRRVAAAGDFKIGLNEVQVGLPVPRLILAAHRLLIGGRESARLAVPGTLIGPDEALRIGLVDELAPPEEVAARAIAWCEALISMPVLAMSATRREARRELVALFDTLDDADLDYMTDWWFSPECQAALKAMVERVKKK